MAKLDVLDISGKNVGSIELDDAVFGLDEINEHVLWEVVKWQLAKRRAAWKPAPPRYHRGYAKLYVEHVTQADQGADFDFLQHGPAVPEPDIF